MRELSVVAFNGSPRADGNTSILLRHVLDELEREGIATACVRVGGRTVREALAAAVPCKRIWRAVWRQLELPDRLR